MALELGFSGAEARVSSRLRGEARGREKWKCGIFKRVFIHGNELTMSSRGSHSSDLTSLEQVFGMFGRAPAPYKKSGARAGGAGFYGSTFSQAKLLLHLLISYSMELLYF